MRQLHAGRVVRVDDVERLPRAAALDKTGFRAQGVRSVLGAPLGAGPATAWAVVVALSLRRWSDADVDAARSFGAMAASMLLRLRAHVDDERRRRFEKAALHVAAALLEDRGEPREVRLCRALELVAGYCGARCAGVWEFIEERSTFRLVASWGRARFRGARDVELASVPWLGRRVLDAAVREPPPLIAASPPAGAERELLRRLGARQLVTLPLRGPSRRVGALALCDAHVRSWSAEGVERLRALAFLVAAALPQKVAAARTAVADPRIQRRVAADVARARDEERRRIAHGLHDGTAQHVLAAALNLVNARRWLQDPSLLRTIDESERLCRLALAEIRTLSFELDPAGIDEDGLAAALRRHAEGLAARTGLVIRIHADEAPRFHPVLESALLSVAREALTNAHQHSRAGEIDVELRLRRDAAELVVRDVGRGSDAEPRTWRLGLGIRGMQERLRQLGGTLEIETGPGGTKVRAKVPLGREVGWPALPQRTEKR